MDEAAALVRSGDPGGVWVVADAQTGGRGRHGRQWVSEPGNLYATLLLVDPCRIERAPQLGFVAGLALHDALSALTTLADRIRLKWPNDALIGDAKLAGILLEGFSRAAVSAARSHAVAIGIGVNLRHHPDDLPYEATDLRSQRWEIAPLDLLAALSTAMRARLRQWAAGEGFAATRQYWLKVAAGLGRPIRVTLQDRVENGVFRDIDGDGRLLMDSEAGVTTIGAGDVAFRRETV